MSQIINEAVQKVAKDSMLQKIDSIAITYKTTDGNIHSFSFLEVGESKYALVGMVEDLKREAFKHLDGNTEDDED